MISDVPFFIDDRAETTVSYERLFNYFKQPRFSFSQNIRNADPSAVFQDILCSMICDQPITVFDNDFSEEELLKLCGTSEDLFQQKSYSPLFHPETPADFIQKCRELKKWTITLFTSGTTGLPKKIAHTFPAFVRAVKTGKNHEQDIWGFAFNPTHMAGLQVFFQAFLNGNTLINLFNGDRSFILDQIGKHGITHLSATPTFYRMLLPYEKPCPSVKQLTSGGEPFSEKVREQLSMIFPNARITNVYASTEAGSLFAAEGESFIVKENLQPFVRIEENELLIHSSLTGASESISLKGDWYHTGDLVEVLQEQPLRFRFVSRKNEMINIGGYKVNPNEVEETVLRLEGVSDVRVFGKKNSVTGNILCCEILAENSDLTERSIRTALEGKLQDYKIPRIIRFVSVVSTSRTGKKNRN